MSDPTNWSDERLAAHAAEFCELPMRQLPPVMDDDDVNFCSDWLYLQGLLVAIHDACIEQGTKVAPLSDDVILSSGLLDLVVNRTRGEWPCDKAAVLLALWRSEGQVAA